MANKNNWVQIILSTMAAAFGVQNKKVLERDFAQSSPIPFIIAGLVFTLLFIMALVFIVHLVLKYAAP